MGYELRAQGDETSEYVKAVKESVNYIIATFLNINKFNQSFTFHFNSNSEYLPYFLKRCLILRSAFILSTNSQATTNERRNF